MSNGAVNINLNADMVDGIQGAQIPLKTTADITYYVNATSGVDSNNGFASGTAFKTIQHAIDLLPKVISHSINIIVASGSYLEALNINNFSGYGVINIQGDSILSTTRIINSLNINKVSCSINIISFNLTTTTSTSIYVEKSLFVLLKFCNIIGNTTTYHGILASTSNVSITDSSVSGKSWAIVSSAASTIFSGNNIGSNNVCGLVSIDGSTLGKYNVQPSGTTAEITNGGGVIR